jgi:hypothetical protein
MIICYQSFENHDLTYLRFFKILAFRVFKKNIAMLSIFERGSKENFRKFYHQALLFMLIISTAKTTRASMRRRDFWRAFREISLRRRFVRRLSRLHVTDTYKSFIELSEYRCAEYYKCMLERYSASLKIADILSV